MRLKHELVASFSDNRVLLYVALLETKEVCAIFTCITFMLSRMTYCPSLQSGVPAILSYFQLTVHRNLWVKKKKELKERTLL